MCIRDGEGIDPQWMSTFAGRQGNATVGKGLLQAVYTNLPPGDYTFKVMASDNPCLLYTSRQPRSMPLKLLTFPPY